MSTNASITNVLSGLNDIPASPPRKLLDAAIVAGLASTAASTAAKAGMEKLIDWMESKGWIGDMLIVDWIKGQPEAKREALTAFREDVIRRTVSTMPGKAIVLADKDVAKEWPVGSEAKGRDYLEQTKANRKYWMMQKGSIVSDMAEELGKRAKAKAAAKKVEGKPEDEAAAIVAQDALIERVNAIVAQAAQAIKALDKAAKAAGEATDSKSRVGKLTGKLRGIVRSGADFGINAE
jgi:hypothetical protein